MKNTIVVFLGFAYSAITRAQFLNSHRAQLLTEVLELQASKDELLADQNRIDKITYGLPILEALIAEVQNTGLRGDWLKVYGQYSAEAESWKVEIEEWDNRIKEVQNKIDEIDRLLALP